MAMRFSALLTSLCLVALKLVCYIVSLQRIFTTDPG
uniref:Uncharacterized protein n=1 Tax=Tetranychus urticae TaxID=32264 RepID=T1K6P3_TETUR